MTNSSRPAELLPVAKDADLVMQKRLLSHQAEAHARSAVIEPPEKFYWARLAVPAEVGTSDHFLHRRYRGQIEEQLAAEVLPPLDGLEWVAAPDGPNHLLACLQEREAVAGVHATGALHYGPAAAPSDSTNTIDPQSLNFLVGPFSPPMVVRAKRRVSIAVAITALALGALLSWGLERRGRLAEVQALTTAQQTASILRAEGQTSLAALNAKRDQMAVTRQRLTDRSQADAGLTLAALLKAWPAGETAPVLMTDSVSVAPDQILLQCSAMSREDATRLAERLSSFPERAASSNPTALADRWVLGQPQITAAAGGSANNYPFKVSLRFSRAKGTAVSTSVGEAHE